VGCDDAQCPQWRLSSWHRSMVQVSHRQNVTTNNQNERQINEFSNNLPFLFPIRFRKKKNHHSKLILTLKIFFFYKKYFFFFIAYSCIIFKSVAQHTHTMITYKKINTKKFKKCLLKLFLLLAKKGWEVINF